jgi:hypothetical protein
MVLGVSTTVSDFSVMVATDVRRRKQGLSLSINHTRNYGSNIYLPHLQHPATVLCPEPDESILHGVREVTILLTYLFISSHLHFMDPANQRRHHHGQHKV